MTFRSIAVAALASAFLLAPVAESAQAQTSRVATVRLALLRTVAPVPNVTSPRIARVVLRLNSVPAATLRCRAGRPNRIGCGTVSPSRR